VPDPVRRLLNLARIKGLAKQLKMDTIILKNDVLKLLFHQSMSNKINGSRLFQLVSPYGRKVGLISDVQIGISVKVKGMTENEWLQMVIELLKVLVEGQIIKEEHGEKPSGAVTGTGKSKAL
jgi:transcription-repair coupling factor (superfamily II helicase)